MHPLDVIKYLNLIRRISQPDARIQLVSLLVFILPVLNFHRHFPTVTLSNCQLLVVWVVFQVENVPCCECEVALVLSAVFYQETFRCQHVLVLHVLRWVLLEFLSLCFTQCAQTYCNRVLRRCEVSACLDLNWPILLLLRLTIHRWTNQCILRFKCSNVGLNRRLLIFVSDDKFLVFMDVAKHKQGCLWYFLFCWMLILLECKNVIEFWEEKVLLSCSVFQLVPVERWVQGFFFNKWFGVDDECLILLANIWKLGLVELSYDFLNSKAFFGKSFLRELKLLKFIFQFSLILLVFVHNFIEQSQGSGFIIL